ncbi:unnamed protein product [Citrullus colocynthis]|uniref:Uncharacterized protein n=1 Tax=Citrullus colocynthis TaxID=252529 RepID=A0ABP0Y1U1_9ROSI
MEEATDARGLEACLEDLRVRLLGCYAVRTLDACMINAHEDVRRIAHVPDRRLVLMLMPVICVSEGLCKGCAVRVGSQG